MTNGVDVPGSNGDNKNLPDKRPKKSGDDLKLISMLGKTLEPFFDKYSEVEKAKLALEEKVIGHEADPSRRTFWGAIMLGGVTLTFAGILFPKSRDDAGMKLISTVAAIAGAAFGGYGIASRRRRSSDDGD